MLKKEKNALKSRMNLTTNQLNIKEELAKNDIYAKCFEEKVEEEAEPSSEVNQDSETMNNLPTPINNRTQ